MLAQIVATPGADTNVKETPNGLDQVDIARPSAAGVSVNNYQQFDVQKPGAILNNSPTIVNTVQAGTINGNPNFAVGESARIIVNQVHSANPTFLRGHAEVAGQRAEVVIANPSGIVVDGGGFINTSRATLTTGQPHYGADGTLSGFEVQRGIVAIQGNGLNAANVDQVDLIARAVTANSAIHADKLNIITGTNFVEHKTLSITNRNIKEHVPQVSIDVGHLGGMYANRIRLIGTERGVGVKLAGTLLARAGDLTLQSNGKLALSGSATTSDSVHIDAHHGILHTGTTYAKKDIVLHTASRMTNDGTLAARRHLNIHADTVSTKGTFAAGVNQDGIVSHAGDLTVTSRGEINASGQHTAGGSTTLRGNSINLTGSKSEMCGAMSLNALDGDIDLSRASIGAIGSVTAKAKGALISDQGRVSSERDVTVAAQQLSNRGGTLTAKNALTIHTDGTLQNHEGKLVARGAIRIDGEAIINRLGTIQSGSALHVAGVSLDNSSGRLTSLNDAGVSVEVTGRLLNAKGHQSGTTNDGLIGGNGKVTVRGGTISNSGTMKALSDLHVVGQSIDNGNGRLQAGRMATVHADQTFQNENGAVLASARADVRAEILDNQSGTLVAPLLSLDATDLLNKKGIITHTGNAAMRINVSRTLNNADGGTLQTNSTHVMLSPAFLVNDGGTIRHASEATTGSLTLPLSAENGRISNVGGTVISNGKIVARAKALDNRNGSISARAGIDLSVHDTLDNTRGKIASDTDAKIDSGRALSNDHGAITAHTAATVRGGSMTNQDGTVIAPMLNVISDNVLNNARGVIEADQLALKAHHLTNHNGKISHFGTSAFIVDIRDAIDNTIDGTIQTNSRDLALTPKTLINDGGVITHAGRGTLKIELGEGNGAMRNKSGRIVSAGDIDVGTRTFDNLQGLLSAKGTLVAKIHGDLNNTQGQLRALGSMSVHNAGHLTNISGSIQSGGAASTATTLDIRSNTIDNSASGLLSQLGSGKATVRSNGQTLNRHGVITSNGSLHFNASSLVNTDGGQVSGMNVVIAGNALDNRGGTIGTIAQNVPPLSALTIATQDPANNNDTQGNLSITLGAGLMNAEGRIGAARHLTIDASTLIGGGAYSATQNVALFLKGDFTTTPKFQFIAGNDLAFRLPGTFINTTALRSANNLFIDAGDIVNGSEISARNLLSTGSRSLMNSGALTGANVSLQADKALVNAGPTALIGATDENGTLALLSSDIQNRDDTSSNDVRPSTTIYGAGKVVLAGGKTSDGLYTKAAQILNQSALIQSGADLTFFADRVTNTRRILQTSGFRTQVDPAVLERLGVSMRGRTGQKGVRDPNSIGGAFVDPPHGGKWNSTYQFTSYFGEAVANTITSTSAAAQIVSGGKIDAQAVGTLQNYWSNVTAVGNITMPKRYDANGWAATGQQAPSLTVTYSGQYHYNNYNNRKHDWKIPFGNAPFIGSRPHGYIHRSPADVRHYKLPDFSATLTSNGTISGTGAQIDNTVETAKLPTLGLLPGRSLDATPIAVTPGQIRSGNVPIASIDGQSHVRIDPVLAAATAIDVLGNLRIPQGGLYRPTRAPNAAYLIETNPAFTDTRRFLSSNYFFRQIGVDTSPLPKRLGDGFYEQQLIRSQITALTGRAVIGPFTNIQSMYESLLDSGAALYKSLNLTAGMGLSSDQVAQLTRNVILMEKRLVDGQSVLVPVVYLAKNHQTTWDGPLISAKDIDLKNTASFVNSGTVSAINTLSIDSKKIENAFGALQSGGLTTLTSAGNVDLTSASLTAGSLKLAAAGDLILNTATDTIAQISDTGASRFTKTLGPIAKIEVAGDAAIATGGDFQQQAAALLVDGDLGMQIGGDWRIGSEQVGEEKIAARINGLSHTDLNETVGSVVSVGGNAAIGVGGDLVARGALIDLKQGGTIAAYGDVSLGAASATSIVHRSSSDSDRNGSYSERMHSMDETLTGTALTSGSTVSIISGKDITLSGSAIRVQQGDANLIAADNVHVEAASEKHFQGLHETQSRKRFLRGSAVQSGIDQNHTQMRASMISADGVAVVSGRDIQVTGSNVVGSGNVTLKAHRNVHIDTSQDTLQSSTYTQKQDSGLMSNGGLSLSIGSRAQSVRRTTASVQNNGSAVGALQGDLMIIAGNDLRARGSVLHAGNDLKMLGSTVEVDAAFDTQRYAEQQRFRQAGLTLGFTNPILAAAQTANQMAKAAKRADGDARLNALAAATTGLAAKNALNAVDVKGVSNTTSVGINLSVGASKSDSQTQANASTVVGSILSAGKNVTIIASGSGRESHIDVIGSTISAGSDTTLAAEGDVNLQAAKNTSRQHSKNSGVSASLGVSFTVGSQNGIGLNVGVAGNRGRADGASTTWTNTHVNAGDTLTIRSGANTNLVGAVASGKRVVADIGGDLNIESLQDVDTFESKQRNAGVSLSLCVPPLCIPAGAALSGSANVGQQKMRSNFATVTERAGINAGNAGFQIKVSGNTDLVGGAISSTDAAVEEGRNRLTTATLTHSDIENRADYGASSIGVGGGIGAFGKKQNGEATTIDPVPGTVSSAGTGLSANAPVAMRASRKVASTTRSGISNGTLSITDGAAQEALTRSTADETVARINRNTSDSENAFTPIFDKEKIDAAFEITSQFTDQVANFVVNRGREADAAEVAANDPTLSPEQRAHAQQKAEQINAQWGPGGKYRRAMTALGAAAGGKVTGGIGRMALDATVNYVQGLAVTEVKRLADGMQSESARAALHAMVGCAGAAASSQSCGAGAMGAAASSVLGALMGSTEGLSGKEKEAQTNAVSSLVSAVAGTMGGQAATASNAAMTEGSFNRQLDSVEKSAITKRAGSDKDAEGRLTRAACLAVKCWAEFPVGSDAYKENYVSILEAPELEAETAWVKRQQEAGLFKYKVHQKIMDGTISDPKGVANDVTKMVTGGLTAKVGATICATGSGCALGIMLAGFGAGTFVEGSDGLYSRYQGIPRPGTNPIRYQIEKAFPIHGTMVFDTMNLGASLAALYAKVPLKMGVEDGMNRATSMFGVTVPRLNNPMFIPFLKTPAPYGTAQGMLFIGVGMKARNVVNDIKKLDEK